MATDDSVRDIFVSGLRNAHAVENEALSIMNRQLERLENYPDLADRLRRHVDETNGQIQRLETILQDLDESHSSMKDAAGSFVGSMAALGHTVASDEILKNSYANFAFENFEAAAYRSLITVAEAGNYSNAVPLLRQTLAQEQDMAQWIEDHLPAITRRYIDLEMAGHTAKR